MRTPTYESMTKVVVIHNEAGLIGVWNIRVWRSEAQRTAGPIAEVADAIKKAPQTEAAIRTAIEALPDVAAYEITDAWGNGDVTYFDWPN